MSNKLKVPKFKNEDEERKYWSKLELSKYFKAEDFESISFANLKPTSRSISIRLPQYLLIRIKEEANELNVPYQSLMKRYLAEGIFSRKSQKNLIASRK